jgi:hypothetical protein
MWGPLGAPAGDWEGDRGLDVSFHNAAGRVNETRFRERATFAPFGPVQNGGQCLYGLDYTASSPTSTLRRARARPVTPAR